MHIIFVVQATPKSEGHGSNHRAYQVAHDLQAAVGTEHVTIFDYGAESRVLALSRPVERYAREQVTRLTPTWQGRLRRFRQELRRSQAKGRSLLQEQRRLLSLLLGGPYGERAPVANRTLERYNDPHVLARYHQQVRTLPRPLVCVVRHSAFARLAWTNRKLGIATVACPANLEAFDQSVTELDGSQRALYLTSLNFGDELCALAACDARLFISRVETGLVNGLGLPSRYYPYRPVGIIHSEMMAIRQRRAAAAPKTGLFVMLGSADHPTTNASFRWFLQEAARHGLPAGVRVVVCGRNTEMLTSGAAIPGIEGRGWVAQNELHELLITAQGVLLPQHIGFGGLTRLAELSCAHVPSIVSVHATHAVQPMPPGFLVVGEQWAEWQEAIQRLVQGQMADAYTAQSYEVWEASQMSPLPQILSGLV